MGTFTNREDRKAAMKFAFRNAGRTAAVTVVATKTHAESTKPRREPESGARHSGSRT